MDYRTKKLITKLKNLHPRDGIDRLYVSRKGKEEESLVLEIVWLHEYVLHSHD